MMEKDSVKSAVREMQIVGFLGVISMLIFFYPIFKWANNVAIERGEPPIELLSLQNIPLLMLLLFSIAMLSLGVCLKKNIVWSYRVVLYTTIVFFVISLLWLIAIKFQHIVLITLGFLSLYILFRLANPKVKKQFSVSSPEVTRDK
ncbi:MAG: hypothetical protein ABIA97_01845 [Candidatus Omnitrophota bacterium]